MKKETIYLAGGCFWGTEKYMRCVDGVLETRVGYALGEKPLWNPPLKESVTYEEVCNHSGHAEEGKNGGGDDRSQNGDQRVGKRLHAADALDLFFRGQEADRHV